MKLPIQKIRHEQVPTPRVGIGQERLIGRAVVTWARLEASLHDLIWTIQGKGLAEGREETEKHMVGRLLKELRRIGSGSSTEIASTDIRMAVLTVAGSRQGAQRRSQSDSARYMGRTRRRSDCRIVAA